jgi:hypothetical protein
MNRIENRDLFPTWYVRPSLYTQIFNSLYVFRQLYRWSSEVKGDFVYFVHTSLEVIL